jgi:hypothetical protein
METKMAGLSEGEITALSTSISNRIELKVRVILDEHREEMIAASEKSREVTFEAGTGFAWDKRHYVRETIQWAFARKESQNRRWIALWGALTVITISQMWEYIEKILKKLGLG